MSGLNAIILFVSMALTSAMLLLSIANSDGWM